MPLFRSETVLGRKPLFTMFEATGGDHRFEYVIEGAMAVGDVIWMGDIPANFALPVDAMLVSDDIDVASMSGGVLNESKTGLDANPMSTWFNAVDIGANGGSARSTAPIALTRGSEFDKRPVGVVLNGAVNAAMKGKRIVMILSAVA